MRVTVCELPHESTAFRAAWTALCEHTTSHASRLVLLPELASVEPVWDSEHFDPTRWNEIERFAGAQLGRLRELGTEYVVGTRPVSMNGRRLNQGYLWSAATSVRSLRSKYFMPEEAGNWERTWFQQGDRHFPRFHVDSIAFGLNICTELWAVETHAAYADLGVELVLSPRATSLATTTKWLAAGVAAAVRSGAFNLSSNRVEPSGACGGRGWIIDPDGDVLALTSADEPFATRDIDLSRAKQAKGTYPRYVFSESEA